MRHRIMILVMVVTAALGAGAAVSSGSAQAAILGSGLPTASGQAAAATTYGPYYFYLYDPSGDTNCIVTNGAGNQLTDSTSGCARITLTTDGSWNGLTAYQFKDGSGNCVRANNSDVVKIESGPCNTGDTGEQWVITHCDTNSAGQCDGNQYRFENVLQELWMKTTGYVPGNKVWVGTGGANDWDLR